MLTNISNLCAAVTVALFFISIGYLAVFLYQNQDVGEISKEQEKISKGFLWVLCVTFCLIFFSGLYWLITRIWQVNAF